MLKWWRTNRQTNRQIEFQLVDSTPLVGGVEWKVYFPKVYFPKVCFRKVYCRYASILGPNFFDPKLTKPIFFKIGRTWRLAHLPSFCELVLSNLCLLYWFSQVRIDRIVRIHDTKCRIFRIPNTESWIVRQCHTVTVTVSGRLFFLHLWLLSWFSQLKMIRIFCFLL